MRRRLRRLKRKKLLTGVLWFVGDALFLVKSMGPFLEIDYVDFGVVDAVGVIECDYGCGDEGEGDGCCWL